MVLESFRFKAVKRYLFFYVLTVHFPVVFAAPSCDEILEDFVKYAYEEPRQHQITVWKYVSDKSPGAIPFESASVSTWTWNQEGSYRLSTLGTISDRQYFPAGSTYKRTADASYLRLSNPLQRELESGSHGESLIEKNQDFSLQAMQDIDYIDQVLRDEQASIPHILVPDQTTVFEYTVEYTESELIELFGKIPFNARLEPDSNAWVDYQNSFANFVEDPETGDYFLDDTPREVDRIYQLKTGMSWLLAGQVFSEPRKLFLEDGMERPIDRSIMKHIWEVGRAGQTPGEAGRSARLETRAFAETLRASCYFILRELMISGGSLDDAYIFGHALKPMHARLYRSLFGMTVYSKYTDENRKEEVVLYTSLRDMIKRFPPDEFINWTPNELFEDKEIAPFSPVDSLQLVLNHQQSLMTYLENSQDAVVTVRNFSTLPFVRAQHFLDDKLLLISENTRQRFYWDLNQVLARVSIPLLPSDYLLRQMNEQSRQGKIPSFMPPRQNIRDFLFQNRAIEIQINGNKQVNTSILVAQTLAWILNDLSRNYANPLQFLKELGVTIAVTSYGGNPLPVEPQTYWYLPTYQLDYTMSFGGIISSPSRYFVSGPSLVSRIYSLDDVLSLPIPASAPSLVRGAAHQQHHLYQPEFFTGD